MSSGLLGASPATATNRDFSRSCDVDKLMVFALKEWIPKADLNARDPNHIPVLPRVSLARGLAKAVISHATLI
jgi:hypothetical protein